ncbi:MAG: cytochrome c5 family protein [Candidatus Accumulibacter sp.]|uniref:c-type cytochrome n=1 Tax=Accumulibacter sp. TaxID=2053492 RepID=UPI001D55FA32|nr:c-type cytochrome [Accumulibacter sp.]MCB1941020.1 cytochrome c5 family protein [Accumulibacter sp.]MCP5248866.1 cytochrome c5 family protein [Accumulibacter sp.]
MAQKQNSSRAILVITIVIAVVLIVVIWPLSMIGKGSVATGDSDAVYARILPVAKIELAKAPAAAADGQARDGAAIYNSICMACHASGVAGAPKAGDAAAWAPRIATGTDALVASVTNGKGAMPPKGGGSDLTDDEIKAAVAYLVGLAK